MKQLGLHFCGGQRYNAPFRAVKTKHHRAAKRPAGGVYFKMPVPVTYSNRSVLP
ncbi:MAG: hypothetical protein IPM36_13485 [Lewinellaceae bacterium]|nr:hypothetical protein [Lewinellaceae bacterium]